MGFIDIISDKLEHRRVVKRYGGKRRKNAVAATQKITADYDFEVESKKPGLMKRISSIQG